MTTTDANYRQETSMAESVILRLDRTREVQHRGRHSYGPAKTVRLPRYTVLMDGEPVGVVERTMVTRERSTPGRRYVDARWESPGWVSGKGLYATARIDYVSRVDALQGLFQQLGHGWSDALALARSAKVGTEQAGDERNG